MIASQYLKVLVGGRALLGDPAETVLVPAWLHLAFIALEVCTAYRTAGGDAVLAAPPLPL